MKKKTCLLAVAVTMSLAIGAINTVQIYKFNERLDAISESYTATTNVVSDEEKALIAEFDKEMVLLIESYTLAKRELEAFETSHNCKRTELDEDDVEAFEEEKEHLVLTLSLNEAKQKIYTLEMKYVILTEQSYFDGDISDFLDAL